MQYVVKYKKLKHILENFIWSEGRTMKKRWERLIAAVMSVVMVQTVCPPQAMALAASEVKEAAEYLEIDQLFSATQSAVTTDSPENVETQTSAALFQDGAVRIYHALQLYAIGSNAVVHSGDAQAETFGTGTVLTDENGQVLLYDSDGTYQLMNDIALPEGTAWTLPSGFSGTFVSEGESTEAPLYDEDTDTIYIYNNYQLLTRAAEDELKTVLSGDNVAETFGLGQVVYAGDQQLEYTQEHNYVVAQSFTGKMPELKAEEILSETTQDATPGLDGRDYIGQVVYYEPGDTDKQNPYILIGNEQQLRAIGDENVHVTPMLYVRYSYAYGLVKKITPYYPGDADYGLSSINGEEFLHKYTELPSVDLTSDSLVEGILKFVENFLGTIIAGLVGYDSELVGHPDSGEISYENCKRLNELRHEYGNLTYSADANYIIFRNIALTPAANGGGNWTPLMFSGTMEGRLNMQTPDPTNPNDNSQPTISNVQISTGSELNLKNENDSTGVGFFSIITNDIYQGDGSEVYVKNIALDVVSVDNNYTEIKDADGLITTILGDLGELLDWLTGELLGLEDLLTADDESAEFYATGAFAGRITGPVTVENCDVTLGAITSEKSMVGGFVGSAEGLTEYDGLSSILNNLTGGLKTLLDAIPGLGLGDLIKVLLKNPKLIDLSNLIPCGYQAPTIKNCTVVMEKGTIGSTTTSFNGGFVGCQTGATMDNCTVYGLASVQASSYAGGFAGAIRDGSIEGLLSGGGIDLFKDVIPKLRNMDPSAKNVNCKVNVPTEDKAPVVWTVSATNYAGGFAGIVANSDITGAMVQGLSSVVASGNYAGGLTGRATLGSGLISLGDEAAEGETDYSLLGQVKGLLQKVLTGESEKDLILLNVLGVSPSNIQSCTVTGDNLKVTAADFAGGFIGQGDGVQVGRETDNVGNSVSNLTSVTATDGDYAGGAVSQMVPANAAGVVDGMLNAGNMIYAQLSDVTITGTNEGFTVTASGKYAGGAVGVSVGGNITNVNVSDLKKVSAMEAAGGFMGSNSAAGLLNSNGLNLLGWDIIKVDNLLGAVQYFLTRCKDCYVSYSVEDNATVTERTENLAEPQVTANSAGGFIGEMYGGSLDNSKMSGDSNAVRNVTFIQGMYYAGGFAGKITSGSLVQAGDGIDLLGITVDLNDLLSVLQVYIPRIISAGVSSGAGGLRVKATHQTSSVADAVEDVDSGSAGGYAGLIRGAQITSSNVTSLATKMDFTHTEPENGDWAVTAPNHAGGYAGQIDVGSVTAAGDGVQISGIANIGDLLNVLNVVESRLDQCDVKGMPGGFNVQSTNGSAGGYAGEINGSWLNGCDADTYEYIHGFVSAGGFVGTIQPGDMANLIKENDKKTVLGQLVGAQDLLSVAQTLIPRIYNSSTAAIPCGGYVKATGTSDGSVLRGMAGGYAGYNLGGRIWGTAKTDPADLSANPAALAEPKLAETKRVREVEGQEYAGGFTGLMQAANIADTGELSLLFGLVETSNLLSALQAVYPTETNTKTTGPLRGLDEETWNAWVKAVGSSGVYGAELTNASYANIGKYIYGYTVTAKAQDNGTGVTDGGAAGGYVGRMETGVITNAYAQDVKLVTAYRSSGGFAGEMDTGTVANIGEVSLAGITVTDGLGLVKTFVPVIYSSRVDGYQSGMSIEATGETDTDAIGNAGGFVGACYGGQIWDEIPADEDLTFEPVTDQAGEVGYLKRVSGARYAGGFAGVMNSGSVAQLDTESESGLLNLILKQLIHSTTDTITSLANVLNATVPTVKSAAVNAPEKNGMTMDYVVEDASCAAGGFVGMACGAVLGHRDETSSSTSLTVYGLRAVMGDEHVGGFCGLAEMGGAAQVANEETSILKLIRLANVDVLNILRTYFYDCYVKASSQGLSVYAMKASDTGGSTTDESDANQVYRTGNAGGFCGSLLNATVFRSHVDGLKLVRGINYVGGFAGLSGKSGVVDVDKLDLFGTEQFLVAAIGVLDVFGSRMDECSVKGMSGGYTVSAIGGKDTISGGLVGYGDLSRITNCDVEDIKQVYSDQQAGGFIGRTSFAYLAKINGMSLKVLNPILLLVNALLKALYLDELENINLADIKIPGVLEIEVLKDGDVLKVDLMGLVISVALVKDENMAQIHIGDSYVEIPCSKDGITEDALKIGLIKANRTKVANCTVAGVTNGYDVFGGGATNDVDGSNEFGYAGGFVGFNKEGLLEYNTMDKADTIRGTEKLVGAFSGITMLKSVYDFNTLKSIEGMQNRYTVYRLNEYGDELDRILYRGQIEKPLSAEYQQIEIGAVKYHSYTVIHRGPSNIEQGEYDSYFQAVWEDAMLNSSEHPNALAPANVYVSSAQAQLMLGVATEQNRDTTVPQGGAMQDPCSGDIHLTIEKIWYDNENKGGTRPSEITVTLYQDEGIYPIEGQNSFKMNNQLAGMDANIWTYEVDVPADGASHTYSVSEKPVEGYVTFYYSTSDDPYTLYILNFLITELMVDDTVVIDYGLPVAVDVLDNDALGSYQIAGELAGVATFAEEDLYKTFPNTKRTFEKLDLSYGTAVTNIDEGVLGTELYDKLSNVKGETTETDGGSKRDVYYVPDTMQMDSLEKMLYVVALDSKYVKNGQNYITGELSIIPATEIFYEDNFGAIKPNPGYTKDDTKIVWTPLTGEGSDTQQDTDRPGSAELGKLWDDLYGNDTHYKDDSTYSNGTAWYVEVGEDTKTSPSVEFAFTGTGFDLISVTSGDTGYVLIEVYDKENQLVRRSVIDTYYGYVYDAEKDEWIVDENADNSNALYQVPIAKVDGLGWGEYSVKVMPVYEKVFDHHYQEGGQDNSYTFYLDAIRVYNPANPLGNAYEDIKDVYLEDGEFNPQFKEIRNILLNANNTSAVTEIGAVFVDGNGALTDIEDYKAYGPKHEVYLAPGQAISFNLETTTGCIPDKLQLSAKLESGSSTQMTIELAVPDQDQQWVSFRAKTHPIETAYDLYYEFGEQCVWEAQKNEKGEIVSYKTKFPIVIRNSSSSTTEGADVVPTDDPNANLDDKVGNLLSLTNLKWTGNAKIKQEGDGTATVQSEENRTAQQDLLVTSSWENVEAAYYLLNPVQQYTVTVKYQDESGNSLAEDQVLQVYDGAEYDATKLLEQAIKGYQFQRVQGEATGVATGDVEIVVIYQKLRMETLQQLIDRAKTMVDCAHKYVKTQWEALLDALAAAEQLLSVEHVTQDQVDDTASALLEAILAQRFQANKENLEAILEQAKDMDLSGYTVESVARFQAALDAAQAVMDDDSLSEEEQQTVDAATEALAAAMEGLTAETEPEEPEATDAPQATDAPEASQQPEATNAPQTTDEPQATPESDTQVPQTGDESGLTIWLTTLFVCAAAGIGMGMKIKTRKEEQ